MTSVAQTVQCERCKELGPIKEMRVKGVRPKDGSTRWLHRVGYGCRVPAQLLIEETTSLDIRSDSFDEAFRDPEKGYNLTALWRAAGRPTNKQPKYWLRSDEGQSWVKVIPDHLSSALGSEGATWFDDIQPALQYAAYLDPALKEDIYDRYVRSKMVPISTQQIAIWQPVEQDMRALVREEIHAEFLAQEERLESITTRHEVMIDRPVDGCVYIAEELERQLRSSMSIDVLRRLDRGWRYLFISQTGRGEDERLAEYSKKRAAGIPAPVLRKVIRSDTRRRLEQALHKNLPEGVWKVPGKKDEFMVSPDMFDRLIELPTYISSVDIARLRHWILCQQIFEMVG